MENSELANPVRDYVLGGLRSGTLQPDAKLPTERQFVQLLRRPRSYVRKSLTVLEIEGHIVRHVGRGTFIAEKRDASKLVEAGDELDVSPGELIEARLLFEPPLGTLVIKNATSADFRKIAASLDQMENAGDLEEYERGDDGFHLGIALATHNGLAVRIAEMLSAARRNATWGQLKSRRGIFAVERREQVRQQHQAIFDALLERDAEKARQLMVEHLNGVRVKLLGD
jgi:GntR family transcriptional regulator, uxu operon transcriptional repressor